MAADIDIVERLRDIEESADTITALRSEQITLSRRTMRGLLRLRPPPLRDLRNRDGTN